MVGAADQTTVPIRRLQNYCSRRFRALLSATPDGSIPWLEKVAEGEGPGLFDPGDAPWIIHADLGTLVGGIRALLMQALHPGSLAGVRSHSRYRDDPLGRLAGTIRWLTVTTFASRQSLLDEAGRVNRMHDKVRGEYTNAAGKRCPYQAADTDLLLWVHVAFMDSFLRAHQHYASTPIPGGADAYVRLWSRSVEPLGLKSAPMDEAGLLDCLDRFLPELVVSKETREVIHWIQYPPLPKKTLPVYRLLFQAAVVSLPENYRQLLGIRTLPASIVRPLTRLLLRGIRLAIGNDHPLQDAALARIKRSSSFSEKSSVN